MQASMDASGAGASDASSSTAGDSASNSSGSSSDSSSSSSSMSSGPRIVAVGDSITAGSEPGSGTPYPSRVAGIIGQPVANEARPGERAAVAANRISGVLSKYDEDRVLILYGTNEILGGWPIPSALDGLRTIVRTTRADGATPYLATLPPMIGSMARNQPNVDALNGGIRSLARSEGAVLVDVASEFGSGSGLMLPDGFHPNSAGSQVIAFAFSDAIR
jgi:lysophospholipase L1-like esterase